MLTKSPAGIVAAPERKWTTIRAVKISKDGTKEDRGLIAFSHRNLIINFIGAPLARLNGWAWERWYRFNQWRRS